MKAASAPTSFSLVPYITYVSAIGVEVARPPDPPPVLSAPSQSPAPPVIDSQKSDQALPAIPPKLRLEEMWKLVVVALVEVEKTEVREMIVVEA